MKRLSKPCIWLAFPLLALPPFAFAGEKASTLTLAPVTVLGTRTERPTDAIPRSVDTVSKDIIQRTQAESLGEAIDALPNVSLSGSPRVAGEQIRIRGLSGDRVLLLVDGVEQNSHSPHLADGFIDPGLIRKVEVERGPASVLWGSGALGGVVSVRTKDAADLLAPGKSFGARIRGGYQTATDGWLGSATLYGTLNDRVDGLVSFGHHDNDDLELGNGETLKHSAYRVNSLLAKTTFYPVLGQSLQLSHRRTRLTGTMPSNPADVLSRENPLLAREITIGSTRLEWRLMPETRLVDLHALVYHKRTRVDEEAHDLARHDRTEVRTIGLDVTNTTRLDLGLGGKHTLTYGVDGHRNRAEGTRNGHPFPGFPDARRLITGVYAQDEIGWGDWTVNLGLRYDHYQSESEKNVAPDQNADHLSKQLGVVWQTTGWLSLYASYAEAFRAPSLTEIYATGTHFGANHFLPNPGLKPEKAANKEIGLRADWDNLFADRDRLSLNLSLFRNDVEDFIDTIVKVKNLPGPPWVGGTTRSENVTEARLKGLEASARYATDAWFASLGYGLTRGYDETKDQPLADIAPNRWVARVGYTALPWDGNITFRATLSERQDRVPKGTEETPAYVVFDLFTTWHANRHLRLDFGIANILDRSYRRHNAVIPEAGRNIKANLTWKF